MNLKKQIKSKNPEKKQQKKIFFKVANPCRGRERVFNAFESKKVPIEIEGTGFLDHSNLPILTPKQMIQRLPIALPQVKTGNVSENLLNEIRQIIYSLNWARGITKKVYKNIMNSVKV